MLVQLGIGDLGHRRDRPALVGSLNRFVMALHAHLDRLSADQEREVPAVRRVAGEAGLALHDGRVLGLGRLRQFLLLAVAIGAQVKRRLLELHREVAGVGIVAAHAILLQRLVRELHLRQLGLHVRVAPEAQVAPLGHQQLLVLRRVGAVTGVACSGGHRAVNVALVGRRIFVTRAAQLRHVRAADEPAGLSAVGVMAAEALAIDHRLVDHRRTLQVQRVAESTQLPAFASQRVFVLLGVGQRVAGVAGVDVHRPVDGLVVLDLRVAVGRGATLGRHRLRGARRFGHRPRCRPGRAGRGER